MDFKKLGENLGLDEDEFIELAELFVETAPDDIDRLVTAAETNDPDLAAAAAHSLKGSAGNLGFDELSSIAGEAEKRSRANSLEGLLDTVASLKEKLDEIRQSL